MTDTEACRSFINEFYKNAGAPDILVNNAGVTDDSLLFAMKREQWDRVVDTDLNGIFNMTQTVIFHMMKARKGRIINIASISGAERNQRAMQLFRRERGSNRVYKGPGKGGFSSRHRDKRDRTRRCRNGYDKRPFQGSLGGHAEGCSYENVSALLRRLQM